MTEQTDRESIATALRRLDVPAPLESAALIVRRLHLDGMMVISRRHHKLLLYNVVIAWFSALLAVMLLVLLITTSPPAHADPAADDHFVTMLENAGFTDLDRTVAIYNGHIVCGNLWSGVPTQDVTQQLMAANPGLPEVGARAFVAISIQVFCPNINARYKTGA